MERRLRELIKRRPEVNKPGRLVTYLLGELKVEGDPTRSHGQLIERLLVKLEEEGCIELERCGAVLSGYRAVEQTQQLKTKVETETASTAVVQTAALVSTQPSRVVSTPVRSGEEDAVSDLTRAEKVTLALHALQRNADKDGNLFVASTVAVIASDLGIREREAKELNRVLHLLGLRESPNGRNPGGTKPHLISLEVTEITEEMLRQAVQLRSSGDKTLAESPEVVPEVAEAEKQPEADASESANEDEKSSEDRLLDIISELEARVATDSETIEKLTDIITELEAKIAAHDSIMTEGAATVERLTSALNDLEADRNRWRDEVSELRSKLLVRVAPSPAVADVLSRYNR